MTSREEIVTVAIVITINCDCWNNYFMTHSDAFKTKLSFSYINTHPRNNFIYESLTVGIGTINVASLLQYNG